MTVPPVVSPTLRLRTYSISNGKYRTDWQTRDRHGYILTRPRATLHRRAAAELLAFHAITALVRPLRLRDFRAGAPILVSAAEIPVALDPEQDLRELRPYERFIALGFTDFPIQSCGSDEWPDPPTLSHCEALELVRNEPWDDSVVLPSRQCVVPTMRAITEIKARLNTSKTWKAWAHLYQTAERLIALPDREDPISGRRVEHLFCPARQWILVVVEGRIVSVRDPVAHERQSILAATVMSVPQSDVASLARSCVVALRGENNRAYRSRILAAFLDALPAERRRLGLGIRTESDGARAVGMVVMAALKPVADQAARAGILRSFVQALPAEESRIHLPDGTKPMVTGHLLDRLMTRFNMRSPIGALRWLHQNSARLRRIVLPPGVHVSKELKGREEATHWRSPRGWTLVVTGGAVVSVYFSYSSKER